MICTHNDTQTQPPTSPTPQYRPTYALDFLLLHCYDAFKKEGLEFLSLSIAPLYGIGKDATDSRMLRGAFRYVRVLCRIWWWC